MATQEQDQFAKFFGVVGAILGFCYGAAASNGSWGGALVGAVVCWLLGVFFGTVLYRVVMVGFILLGIFIRHEIFVAIGKLFE